MSEARTTWAEFVRAVDALLAVNVVLVILAVPVADELVDAQTLQFPAAYHGAVTAPQPQPPAGLGSDGVAIDNVYAYARAGRLLQDVRLYDSHRDRSTGASASPTPTAARSPTRKGRPSSRRAAADATAADHAAAGGASGTSVISRSAP